MRLVASVSQHIKEDHKSHRSGWLRAAVLGAPHIRVFAGAAKEGLSEADARKLCIGALDEVSDYRGTLPQDSRNFKGDYGNSEFDVHNTFTSFVTRPVGTHSTTKIFPSRSKHASCG